MSKSLEKIRDIKSLINEVYQGELNEGARKSWLCFKQYCDDIKQDLELLEQLKQQRDSLAINNGELCVKVTDLQKENQELKEKAVKAVGFVKLLIDNISNKKLNDDRCSITNIKTGEEYGNLKEYITKMFKIIWDIEIKWLD